MLNVTFYFYFTPILDEIDVKDIFYTCIAVEIEVVPPDSVPALVPISRNGGTLSSEQGL